MCESPEIEFHRFGLRWRKTQQIQKRNPAWPPSSSRFVSVTTARSRTAIHRYLDRCKLAPNTVKVYKQQTCAYLARLGEHAADRPDAFADVVRAAEAMRAGPGRPHRQVESQYQELGSMGDQLVDEGGQHEQRSCRTNHADRAATPQVPTMAEVFGPPQVGSRTLTGCDPTAKRTADYLTALQRHDT